MKSSRAKEKTCSICPRCEGTGKCAECQGTGEVVCPICEGAGEKKTPRGLAYACKKCGGTGKLECTTECSSCEGTGQITSALQRKIQEKYTPRMANTTPLNRASFYLLAINVAIFLFTNYGPPGVSHRIFGALDNPATTLVSNWELWRFITPMFLHLSFMHMLFNGSFLYRYCPPLEGLYGTRRFLALYFFSGICGNILSWLVNCYWGDLDVAGAGASGALMGVGAAYIALHYRWGQFDRAEINSWLTFIGGWLLLGFISHGSSIPMLGNVDNWGHLGGFVGGFAFAWLSGRPLGR